MSTPAWYLAPSLAALWGQVRSTWSNRSTAADGSIGDAAHASRTSDHNPDPKSGVVRALDVTVNRSQATRVLEAVVGDPRVAYVIHDRRIWTPGKGWQPYSGSNPHSGHVHISIKHTKQAEDSRDLWKGLAMAKMHPIIGDGYLSSPYGMRGGRLHAGADYRPRAGYGSPVYATFAGEVIKTVSSRKPGQTNRTNELAAYRTGNGVRVRNPDGESQLYGHVKPAVRTGQKVKAGDLLGHVDNSGNTTGPHVHFEIWNAAGKARNPQIDFRYFGVDPFGGKRGAVSKPSKPAPSKPAPSKPAAPKPGEPSAGVKAALRAMNLPATVEGVKRYQRDHGLWPDGVWGSVTQTYFEWVKSLQRALNEWKAVQRAGRLPITGYRGTQTKNRERVVIQPPLNRQMLGTTKVSLFSGLGIGPEPPKRG